jgi:hypothetical protein
MRVLPLWLPPVQVILFLPPYCHWVLSNGVWGPVLVTVWYAKGLYREVWCLYFVSLDIRIRYWLLTKRAAVMTLFNWPRPVV